ncbi:ABC transporter substrate-binding protein [Rhodococcus sp. IEGM 1379]|uniref:ABC transporter substrate-binding protein n=1 Tax=Rhodococcus sp. IEGM 1379 TaxID=3047086 RepID=UPI0024B68021|nr:ABC transporter substrate-binding protein [Rhodococcus sp. IEGM 1379]MDI9917298.1 ABC transporter substrate-binding protein [Rhodococcus sp. IEGM 1379]
MKVKKFDGYWNPAAQTLGGVEMIYMSDSTAALNAIKSGSADAGQVREAELDPAKNAGLNVIEGFDLGFGNIGLNPNLQPALKDEKVRMAINLAINRQELVDGILFGYGRVTNQPFPKGYFAHNDAVENYPFDPNKAKSLLAEAGYANGFDLTLTVVSGPTQRINEAIADQLSKIGIRTKVTSVEAAALSQQISIDQTIAAATLRWTGRPDPTSTIDLLYMPGGSQNPANLTSVRAIELNNQQRAETDPAKRALILQELMSEFVEHPAASQIVLFESLSAIASNKKVVGLEIWKTGKVEFGGVSMTK